MFIHLPRTSLINSIFLCSASSECTQIQKWKKTMKKYKVAWEENLTEINECADCICPAVYIKKSKCWKSLWFQSDTVLTAFIQSQILWNQWRQSGRNVFLFLILCKCCWFFCKFLYVFSCLFYISGIWVYKM